MKRKGSSKDSKQTMTHFQQMKEELKIELMRSKKQNEEKKKARIRKEGFFFLRKLVRRLKGNDNYQIDEVSDEDLLGIFDDSFEAEEEISKKPQDIGPDQK